MKKPDYVSDCCGAKILMMFPVGADNLDEKEQDYCSKCHKPIQPSGEEEK